MRKFSQKISSYTNTLKKIRQLPVKEKAPRPFQLKQFLKILERREKIYFIACFFLFSISAIFLALNFYYKNTEVQPLQGGTYIEGALGQPKLINPVLETKNPVDSDLAELIFSGLMRYSPQGKIVPDLAKDCQVQDGDRIYECVLKENVKWHDGSPFTADDVVFTIKSTQNPEYGSPLRAGWFGIEVEKISDFQVRFKMRNPYSPFLEMLTLKIMPKHIWENIAPENLALNFYNLQPIGTGPFRVKSIEQKDRAGYINSFTLVRNPDYFGQNPYLKEIIFQFFKDEKELLKALKEGKIMGTSSVSPKESENLKSKRVKVYEISFSRYFDISFNTAKSKVLAEKDVRIALSYGTNKKEIIDNVLLGKAKAVNSPFIAEIYGLPATEEYKFDSKRAKEILEAAGWQDLNQDGKREKSFSEDGTVLFKKDLQKGDSGKDVESLQSCLARDSQIYPEGKISGEFGEQTKQAVTRFQEKYYKEILEPTGIEKGTGIVSKKTRGKLNEICSSGDNLVPLKFSLVTVDQEELSQVAEIIKKQWLNIGAEVEIIKVPLSTLKQDYLESRNYESILFGKIMGVIADPYSFWHSTQRMAPGNNVALYNNKEADKLLEDIRQTLDEKERLEKYQKFQEILLKDAPAVFLYSPDYLFPTSKNIKGITLEEIPGPADFAGRFIGIENWYIKTKRVWK